MVIGEVPIQRRIPPALRMIGKVRLVGVQSEWGTFVGAVALSQTPHGRDSAIQQAPTERLFRQCKGRTGPKHGIEGHGWNQGTIKLSTCLQVWATGV